MIEPFAGVAGFGGALLVAGPSVDYYEALIQEQLELEDRVPATAR